MIISVRECNSKRDIKEFIGVPYFVYSGQKTKYNNWIPPLNVDIRHIFDPKKNKFYEHGNLTSFLAIQNGKSVGRICASIDTNYCKFHNTKTGFIGYFECIDDLGIALSLFDIAEKWLKKQGMDKVIGPIFGSPNLQMGNQIDSFDTPPVIEMPYAAPYYQSFYERANYNKAHDLMSYKITNVKEIPDKITRIAKLARKRNNISIRKIDRSSWNEGVEIAFKIWNDAWIGNWGFVPWSKSDFLALADTLKFGTEFRLSSAAYIGDEPVGFAFPIPDINPVFKKLNGKLTPWGIFQLLKAKKNADIIRIASFGVKKEYRNKGVDVVLLYELYSTGLKIGYTGAEFSWILDDNYAMRNTIERLGIPHYRTHRVYEKDL